MKKTVGTLFLTLTLACGSLAQEMWSGEGRYQVDTRPATSITSLEVEMRPGGDFKIGVNLPGDGFYMEGTYEKVGGGAVLQVNKVFDRAVANGRALLLNDASDKPAHLQGYFNLPDQQTVHIFSFPADPSAEFVRKPVVATGDTTENSLDWSGRYKGVLPCADCQGIETTLILKDDYTFHLIRTYLGKPGKTFSKNGKFGFTNNGSTVVLGGVDKPNRYFIGEGYATQLDIGGEVIEGPLADEYVLNKQ